ncbi:MAG: pyridine nucleotide-disulfide oxidoreductase [Gammaproteobacteria bacterium]|nr:pyridine nucleotide-disulfide oxidoreductase [Gammaproteobacteria bacterium]
MSSIAIIGAGQAGMQLADSLRRGGFEGSVILYGDEGSLPYQRPPLSKQFLLGDLEASRLNFRPIAHYEKLAVTLRLDCAVTQVDLQTRTLAMANGEQAAFDRLAFTTGARVRKLALPGAEDPRVCYLRGITDAQAIRERLATARRVVIIGGGFIGLEVAAVARTLGKEVTVLEAQTRLMPRVVAPVVSAYFEAVHNQRGVRFLLGESLTALAPTSSALGLTTASATYLEADLVVVGIGVHPNLELAAAAGLPCEGGIVVNEFACTRDPTVVAAGDCTWQRNILFERPHRLESVQNAVDQAKVAAASLLEKPVAYSQVPWFWSDQYDVKLQMVGISTGFEAAIVRGNPETGAFSVFYYLGERVLAVDSINRPAEHMAARRLLASGGLLAKELAADPAADLKTIIEKN